MQWFVSSIHYLEADKAISLWTFSIIILSELNRVSCDAEHLNQLELAVSADGTPSSGILCPWSSCLIRKPEWIRFTISQLQTQEFLYGLKLLAKIGIIVWRCTPSAGGICRHFFFSCFSALQVWVSLQRELFCSPRSLKRHNVNAFFILADWLIY